MICLFLSIGWVAKKTHQHRQMDTVTIDAEISKAGTFVASGDHGVFVSSPVTVETGQRRKYAFPGIPADASNLRVDFNGSPDTQIKIFEIKVNEGHSVENLSPNDLSTWSYSDISTKETSKDFILLQSTSPHSFMSGPLDRAPKLLDQIWVAVFFLFVALLLIQLMSPTLWSLLILLYVGVRGVIFTVYHFSGQPFPVHEAIGPTNFFSYPKQLDFLACILAVAVSGGLGFLGGIFRRNKDLLSETTSTFTTKNIFFLLAMTACFAWVAFPPLSQIFSSLDSVTHFVNFDSNNMFAWNYFAVHGELPYRDFWYTYGGFYNEATELPREALRLFVHEVVLFIGVLYATFILLKKDYARTIIVLALIGILMPFAIILVPFRYFLCVVPVFGFMAQQRLQNKTWSNIILGGSLLFAFIYEPNQSSYAVLTQTVLLACYLISPIETQDRRQLIRNFLIQIGIFSVGATLYCIHLKNQGQWDMFVEFFKSYRSMTTYAAVPYDLRDQLNLPLTGEKIIFWAMLVSATAGTYLWFSRKNRESDILIGTGVLTAIIYQKLILLPGMGPQFVGYLILGWSIFISNLSRQLNRFSKRVAFICILIFGWYFLSSPFFPLHPLLSAEKFKWAELDRLQKDQYTQWADRYFAPKNINLGVTNGEQVKNKIELFFNKKVPSFFVLGNDSYLYTFFNAKHPRHVNLYNGSPIESQQEVVRWLEKEKPEIVFWNPSNSSFKEIPHVTQNPLLYQFIVQHYKPIGKAPPFEILQLDQKPMDLKYWNSTLGTQVKLGSIPSISPRSGWQPCLDDSKHECTTFLDLTTEVPPPALNHVPLKIQGNAYTLEFSSAPNDRHFLIPLHRLWFFDSNDDFTFDCPSSFHCSKVKVMKTDRILY